ncbi:MAG TPA: hypothetical protein VNO26_05235 [Candidatus Limnocylindria bacterium]|nr:hypothetical protein [Candidatus Limnocylindria bacterium]
MPSSDDRSAELARTVGLCASCRHAARQETARGSVFWRCRRAETDPRFPRYPRLPVLDCPGVERPDAV